MHRCQKETNKLLGAVMIHLQDGVELIIACPSREFSNSRAIVRRPKTNASRLSEQLLSLGHIFGKPHGVVTNHHSLCWFASLRDPSGHLAMHMETSRVRNYQAIQVGQKYGDANCLRRAPVESARHYRTTTTDFSACMVDGADMKLTQRSYPEI